MYEVIVIVAQGTAYSGIPAVETEVVRFEFEHEEDMRTWLSQANSTCINKEALVADH